MPAMAEMQGTARRKGRSPEWSRMVAAGVKHSGVWATWLHLVKSRDAHSDDLSLRGYCEILRNQIVRELVVRTGSGVAVPTLSKAFTEDYSRFSLNAQEGYLVSLIDGQMSVEQLLKVTPFDPFSTLFTVAKLLYVGAIELPE